MQEDEQVTGKVQPVRKQLQVPLAPEAAFRLFTEAFGRWWPRATHSVGETQTETCVFEGFAGGRIYEILKDGSQAEWGRVLTFEPYRRLVFSWYPGRQPDTAQQVTVMFEATEGGARLDLVHTGWETLGERAARVRQGYQTGWDVVLGQFAAHAGR